VSYPDFLSVDESCSDDEKIEMVNHNIIITAAEDTNEDSVERSPGPTPYLHALDFTPVPSLPVEQSAILTGFPHKESPSPLQQDTHRPPREIIDDVRDPRYIVHGPRWRQIPD
jgi:hypothetical protein